MTVIDIFFSLVLRKKCDPIRGCEGVKLCISYEMGARDVFLFVYSFIRCFAHAQCLCDRLSYFLTHYVQQKL